MMTRNNKTHKFSVSALVAQVSQIKKSSLLITIQLTNAEYSYLLIDVNISLRG